MTGLVRALDSLLTPNVSSPQTVGSVDGDSSVAAPGAVSNVQKVANDVRLLSNAALERQLGGVDSALTRGAKGLGSPAGAALPASAVARLSFAARIISSVLADLDVDVGPVRGQGPVSTTSQLPASPALAGSLAHAVSNSGLFYESHLVEFAQGQRTLAQMAQEPQADFPAPGVIGSARSALAAALAQVAGEGAGAASVPPPTPAAVVASGNPVVPSTTAAVLAATLAAPLAGAPGTGAQQGPSTVAGGFPAVGESQAAVANAVPADATPDALKVKAAYHWSGAAPAAPAAELARLRAADVADSATRSTPAAAATPSGSGDAVHPQLVSLVHQQLDVLATAAFRWTGEAWPGVPMDWRIHDEDAGRPAAGREAVAAERNWSTRLSLQLPVLGTVEVRLTVHGSDVRATVVAPTEGTRTRLAADGRALAARFDAAHLRLEQFQVAEGSAS